MHAATTRTHRAPTRRTQDLECHDHAITEMGADAIAVLIEYDSLPATALSPRLRGGSRNDDANEADGIARHAGGGAQTHPHDQRTTAHDDRDTRARRRTAPHQIARARHDDSTSADRRPARRRHRNDNRSNPCAADSTCAISCEPVATCCILRCAQPHAVHTRDMAAVRVCFGAHRDAIGAPAHSLNGGQQPVRGKWQYEGDDLRHDSLHSTTPLPPTTSHQRRDDERRACSTRCDGDAERGTCVVTSGPSAPRPRALRHGRAHDRARVTPVRALDERRQRTPTRPRR